MPRLFLECTVRAALLVAGTAIILYAMRVKAAAARHAIWTGVLLAMLVLPAWTAWGPKTPLRLLPPLHQITTNQSTRLVAADSPTILPSDAAGLAAPQPIARPRLALSWQAILLGVYFLGLCLFLLRLAIGTLRAQKLVRQSEFRNGRRTSPFCAAPVTVGFFHPVVILPEHWTEWPPAQLDAVLTHESEHARRRDSLIQWLALLNRALFWFHPAAWWLEHHLSTLAEEACDDVVLARGHTPREYSEYLLNIARSVIQSGARLNIPGMAMPGSSLPHRIRQIIESSPAPPISRTRMACVAVACTITCAAFAAGTLDHAQPNLAAQPVTKFVLGDLKIEGEVHDGDGLRNRILKAWKDRKYDDADKLADDVMRSGVRDDFQRRGYFEVVAVDPVPQPLGLVDGKQRILVIAPVTEGEQFRLGTLSIQNYERNRPLSVPAQTLRDLIPLKDGDLLDVSKLRAGLQPMLSLYATVGHSDLTVVPGFAIDRPDRRIDLILRVMEGPLDSGSGAVVPPESSAPPLAQDKPAQAGKNGVGTPSCVYCPAPKYPPEALTAKFQGSVNLSAVVETNGRATNIKVLGKPGLGLGEKAIEAVERWRFKPAPGPDGKPVAAIVPIQVQFNLPKEVTPPVPSAAYQAPADQGSAAAVSKLSFDTASIKENKTGGGDRILFGLGSFTSTNIPLRNLLTAAYQLTPFQSRLISGAPDWIDSKRFDIVASAQGAPNRQQSQMMLQSLLANRFKLAVHREKRVAPVYALELSEPGKTGPYLRPHSDDAKCTNPTAGPPLAPDPSGAVPAFCDGFGARRTPRGARETGTKVTMDMLAASLSGNLDRPILNLTGLSGNFDFDLTINYEAAASQGLKALDTLIDPSPFLGALPAQLGLKLVPQTAPVDVLVIDHVEQPSEN